MLQGRAVEGPDRGSENNAESVSNPIKLNPMLESMQLWGSKLTWLRRDTERDQTQRRFEIDEVQLCTLREEKSRRTSTCQHIANQQLHARCVFVRVLTWRPLAASCSQLFAFEFEPKGFITGIAAC